MVSKKKAKTKNGVRFDSKHIRLRFTANCSICSDSLAGIFTTD